MTQFEKPEFGPRTIEPEDEAGDPAQAFDALRETIKRQGQEIGAEMTVIRRGVESAFDRFETFQQPTDYSADLGRLVQGLAAVGERLKAIEASPILKNGPEHYARAIQRSGEGLVKTAAQQLERQASDLESAGARLAAYTKSAYDRKNQDWRMWTMGGFGLLLGAFLMLLLPRFLPFSADVRTAGLVMGRDPISAGRAMIEAMDPDMAAKMEWGRASLESNGDPLSVCLQTARRTGKDQRCTITVGAPTR